nr:phage/plasmid primase, P4 family [Actinopolymorpha pittospori]
MTFADLGNVEPGEVKVRATSRDLPVSPALTAALAAKLDKYATATKHPHAEGAIHYAAERFGLSEDDFDRLGLGYADDLGGGPRLVVPFRDRDGVPRGFQARALAADAKVRWIGPENPDGASWAKVGYLPGSAGWDEVLVTEGPGDGLTAVALGYDAILIRGAGLASNALVVETVAEWVGDRTAVVAGDGDASGKAFSSTLATSLVGRGVRTKVLDVPEGLDLTSWRERDPARFAKEAVRAVLSAEEITSYDAALRSRDAKAYPLTDLGNARFVRDYIAARGSGVRYSPEAGFFLLGDGVWRADKLDTTRAYVQEAADLVTAIAADLMAEAGADGNRIKEAKAWAAWARHSQSSRGIDAAVRELQALRDVAADLDAFDRHSHLLAARNGVVNLRTGSLQSHDPELLITRRVDLDYDPKAACPRWESFLREVFPSHADLPAYIRRLVGYGVTGDTSEQCFAVLWGTGANGKSVFTDTLTDVFRELTVTTPFSTFEDRGSGGIPNDLAALKGARLVMAAEGEQGRPMAEAVLKRVTGRDLISARFMRKEFFEFRPAFLLLLATNFKPQFRGQDEGLWRRVKLVPWERYFRPSERDHRLGDTLRGEAAGIFAWAVRGAAEWYAGGLQDPPVIRQATTEYRQTSDALSGFFPGVFVAEEGSKVTGKVLWDAYREWTDDEALPNKERWTRRAFFAALEERGLIKRRITQGMAFEGVRRARQTDAVADHDAPEIDDESRTPDDELALYQDDQSQIAGPSLDDVL